MTLPNSSLPYHCVIPATFEWRGCDSGYTYYIVWHLNLDLNRLIYWMTLNKSNNYMEWSPAWEANSHPTSQKNSCLLSNPKVHYSLHKSPPLLLIEIQPLLGLLTGLFPWGFPTKILYPFLMRAICPALDLTVLIKQAILILYRL
jgi:hypothetical protein